MERFRQMSARAPSSARTITSGLRHSPSEAPKVPMRLPAEEKKREDSLAASRKRTAALEREAEEARRAVGAEGAGAVQPAEERGTAKNRRPSKDDRSRLVKSGAAAEAQVAAKAYYKRMHAYLNSSPTFNAQQVELILQRFKVLTASYISGDALRGKCKLSSYILYFTPKFLLS